MIALDVLVRSSRWSELGDVEALARRAAEAAVAVAGAPGAAPVSAAVLLADDATLRGLNRAWRGQDKPTNVLSFPAAAAPGAPGATFLGDIALAFETLEREAEASGRTLADHASHLIVHGVLHLLGHDHEAEREAEAMEALEIEALARLGIPNPYRDLAA